MRFSLSLLLALVCTSTFGQITSKNYDIKVAGIKVGHFVATETIEKGGRISYQVDSFVDINLWLYKMKSTFKSEIIYVDGVSQKARVDMKTNKGDFYTQTTKTANGYHIKGEHEEGKFERVIHEPITASVATLYFHEPTTTKPAFAEFYGDFMKIKKVKEDEYHGEITGNEDIFFYENGILVKTIKKNRFKDIIFEYVDTTVQPIHP